MATATNDKPLRLGDLPVVKTNILENARQFDKGVVGGYNGIFPLTAASQGGIYLLPSTGKFYVCETAYNGTQISAPNSNFVELSVWKNHDRLSNLGENKLIFQGEVNEGQTINFEDISKFRLLIFRNRTNASDTILYRNEFIKNTKFMISAIAIDAKGFSFLQGIILNNTSAYIEKVVTNQVSIANHNHLKIVGVY